MPLADKQLSFWIRIPVWQFLFKRSFLYTDSKKINFCNKNNDYQYTWLCAIAKNTAYDVLKKHNKLETLSDDIPDDADFQQKIENRETAFRIHECLHNMEEPYKEVFQLRVFGELSFADIGKIFHKTESWARVTFHRARLKLQEKMQ